MKKGKKGKKRVKGARPEKQAWLQQTHQWRKDIFVSTGYSAKEIVRGIKKMHAVKWMVDWIEKEEADWQKIIDAGCAFVSMEPKHGALILRLRNYQDTWEFWETLIHELNHVVDGMADNIKFEKEWEARAYLQEYLFHEIRRKLIGAQSHKSNGQ